MSEASPKTPLVAILRGVRPDEALAVANVIYAAGIRIIEVPLNSPEPFKSIAALAAGLHPDCLVGAGTVVHPDDVRRAHAAGGRLVVSPNFDAAVIAAALQLGMQVLPGIATATEAFAAVRAGATQLKLFPASTYGPRHLQALRTVLAPHIGLYAVGGVGAQHIPEWLSAGAAGFGFGSELFRPEYSLEEVQRRAQLLVSSFEQARGKVHTATRGTA
jgi:2-dehydro-3-deoxyphosphogalactonate aldolase